MTKLIENPNELWRTRLVDDVKDVDADALTLADLRVLNFTAMTTKKKEYGKGMGGKKTRHGVACAIGNVERNVWVALAEPVALRACGEEGIQKAKERVRMDTNLSAALRKDEAYVLVEALRLCCEESV